MRVLVDTSVWSLALRRREPRPLAPAAVELQELIREARADLIGPVRQELLSGLSEPRQFERLKARLRDFHDLALTTADYERAAEFSNLCRKRGVQGSNTDFLLCAAGEARRLPILTVDRDFEVFARLLPIVLYSSRR